MTQIKFLKHKAPSSSIHKDDSIIVKTIDPKGTLKEDIVYVLS